MASCGTRRLGALRPITEDMALEVGKVYQVNINVEGLTDPQGTIDYVLDSMAERYPNVVVTWIQASETNQTIDIQLVPLDQKARLTGETFAIGSILLFLPQILALLGIVIVAISAWQMVAAIPWWAWALLGTGVVLWLFGPAIAKMFAPEEPTVLPIAYRKAY